MYKQFYNKIESLITPNIIDYDGKGNIIKKSSRPGTATKINNGHSNNNNINIYTNNDDFNSEDNTLKTNNKIILTENETQDFANNNRSNLKINNTNNNSNKQLRFATEEDNIAVLNNNKPELFTNRKSNNSNVNYNSYLNTNNLENINLKTDYNNINNCSAIPGNTTFRFHNNNQSSFNNNIMINEDFIKAQNNKINNNYNTKTLSLNDEKSVIKSNSANKYNNNNNNNNKLDNAKSSYISALNLSLKDSTTGTNNRNNLFPKHKSIAVIDDIDILKQIIITEKNKNMNLRYENQELKRDLNNYIEKSRLQEEAINKIERIRESDKRYVDKMEDMIKKINNSNKFIEAKNYIRLTDNNNNNNKKLNTNKDENIICASLVDDEKDLKDISNSDNKENINNNNNDYKTITIKNSNYLINNKEDIFTFGSNNYSVNLCDKEQIKDYFYTINKKLEYYTDFVEKIFKISDRKEQLNDSIYTLWRKMSNFFSTISNPNDFELHNLKDILEDFNIVNRNINEIMGNKQSEFNFLLNARQEQFEFINEDSKRLRTEISQLKYDRSIDLKNINELECNNTLLKSRLKELESINRDYNKKLNFVESLGYSTFKKTNNINNSNSYLRNDYNRMSKSSFNTKNKLYARNNNKDTSNRNNSSKDKSNYYRENSSKKYSDINLNYNLLNYNKNKTESKNSNTLKNNNRLVKSIENIENCLDMNDPQNYSFVEKLQSEIA